MRKTLNEDDVLKEIDRWIGYLDEDMITRIKIGIKKLPSAQPEQCKDAVSKAKVLETYADLYDVFDDNKEIQNELHKVFDRINNLPSAQQEPLIRCRECKHWNEYDGMCKILKEYIFNDDYYCGLAERKEGADG